ncbi:MAG: hypothetical protein BGO49_19090 [Planctomycetales bacterium 71-10]|nr:MAG: hypothetical protein BGO49_19090 [Planctomycetales bacterium 71-10]
MMSRLPFLTVVAVVVFALTWSPMLFADDKVHEATVVKAGNAEITLTMKGDDKQHTHDVAKDAEITPYDKTLKLEEMK